MSRVAEGVSNTTAPVRAWYCLLSVAALVLFGCSAAPHPDEPAWPRVTLTPQDRILILAPHPDDEVIGCGGIIQKAVARRLPVRVVFFTYGDNNQWSFAVYRHHPVLLPRALQRMGLIRHDEAIAAAKVLGLSPGQLTFLGYPDFGTLHIWSSHWNDQPPFRSMLTRVTAVPYPNARRHGAAYKGEEILKDLTEIIREFRPTKVFVSHPGDHMPDHRALYLFARVALWDLEPDLRPAVYPYLVHFTRWPVPRGYRPSRLLSPPALLRQQVFWQTSPLNSNEVSVKRTALKAHRTQYGSSARYLLSFVSSNELFGDFPVVHAPTELPGVPMISKGRQGAGEPSDELTSQERAAFVGLEWRLIQLEGGRLKLSIQFSRPLARTVGVSAYVFGYRRDRPFAWMPKIHIRVDAWSHAVYDQARRVPEDGVEISRTPTQITVALPLELLGAPDRILLSARSYLGAVPLDWVSWRILELVKPPGPRLSEVKPPS